MTQKIIVSNLPSDVGVEEIRSLLTEAGAEQVGVTLNNEGDADLVTAVLVLADIDRAAADRIAARINGARYRDRTLAAYVPLFM